MPRTPRSSRRTDRLSKDGPDVVCGYKLPQLRSAYGVKSANMGKGWKVAIVDAYDSKTIVSDSTKYFQRNDRSNPFSRAHLVRTDAMPFTQASVCDASSWLVEQAIDIQSVHGRAGNAGIRYVGAKNCFNSALFAADQYAVDNHIASAVSNSWGDPSGDSSMTPRPRTPTTTCRATSTSTPTAVR